MGVARCRHPCGAMVARDKLTRQPQHKADPRARKGHLEYRCAGFADDATGESDALEQAIRLMIYVDK